MSIVKAFFLAGFAHAAEMGKNMMNTSEMMDGQKKMMDSSKMMK